VIIASSDAINISKEIIRDDVRLSNTLRFILQRNKRHTMTENHIKIGACDLIRYID